MFTKAVEQLGTDKVINRPVKGVLGEALIDGDQRTVVNEETVSNIEVRLGAIYALERVSQISERDHIAVMETLCAYVRENSSAEGCEDVMTESGHDAPETTLYEAIRKLQPPRTDVQAAVTVLGRRLGKRIRHERSAGYRLDLRHSNLRKANLAGGDFGRAIFAQTRLEGASFRETKLESSDFFKSHIIGSDFRNSFLQEARFYKTRLSSTRLSNAEMALANVSCADFTGMTELSEEMIRNCFGCEGTVVPEYLKSMKPVHWHPIALRNRENRLEAYQHWKAARASGEKPEWVGESDWDGW